MIKYHMLLYHKLLYRFKYQMEFSNCSFVGFIHYNTKNEQIGIVTIVDYLPIKRPFPSGIPHFFRIQWPGTVIFFTSSHYHTN